MSIWNFTADNIVYSEFQDYVDFHFKSHMLSGLQNVENANLFNMRLFMCMMRALRHALYVYVLLHAVDMLIICVFGRFMTLKRDFRHISSQIWDVSGNFGGFAANQHSWHPLNELYTSCDVKIYNFTWLQISDCLGKGRYLKTEYFTM